MSTFSSENPIIYFWTNLIWERDVTSLEVFPHFSCQLCKTGFVHLLYRQSGYIPIGIEFLLLGEAFVRRNIT